MLWRCYVKEEPKSLEQLEKAKEIEISLDQILGEELYSDSQDQVLYSEYTLFLYSTPTLMAWDRIQEPEK